MAETSRTSHIPIDAHEAYARAEQFKSPDQARMSVQMSGMVGADVMEITPTAYNAVFQTDQRGMPDALLYQGKEYSIAHLFIHGHIMYRLGSSDKIQSQQEDVEELDIPPDQLVIFDQEMSGSNQQQQSPEEKKAASEIKLVQAVAKDWVKEMLKLMQALNRDFMMVQNEMNSKKKG